jgi:predicted transcriptional regulator YdeE
LVEYSILQRPAFDVVGVPLRTSRERQKEEIPSHWQRFLVNDRASAIPDRLDDSLLGVYTEYEAPPSSMEYSLTVGCRVSAESAAEEGMVRIRVPESSYAVFALEGPFPEALVDAWEWVRNSDLPRIWTADFEDYRFRAGLAADPNVVLNVAVRGPADIEPEVGAMEQGEG